MMAVLRHPVGDIGVHEENRPLMDSTVGMNTDRRVNSYEYLQGMVRVFRRA
jgi:hypothetical protein